MKTNKIIKIENVFTNKERKKLLKDCYPLLIDGKELGLFYNKDVYPGKQTHPTLHLHPGFSWAHDHILRLVEEKIGLNFEIQKSWILCIKGKIEDTHWHTHTSDYSCVYYMRTTPPFGNGTFFKHGFVEAPENSIICFPSDLKHTAPASPFRFERYTLAINLNIIR